MKSETRSFYEQVVQAAVQRIVGGLDEALDLGALARGAALSPLHFHRIFRGRVGETPLELHRRLRLERAALGLATGEAPVTRLAFEAGYETHESFTRAFRDAFAVSPTGFRARAREARAARALAPSMELAARCGLHFTASPASTFRLTDQKEDLAMNVEIVAMPELRIGAVSHRGPYNTISDAFGRLGALAGPAGLMEHPDAGMIALYLDDPDSTPASELRSEAGVIMPPGVATPRGLTELRLPAGRYARATHVGPYALLGDAWAALMGGWLAQSGERLGAGGTYERYLNTPMNAKPSELRTDLYVSLAG